jgi:hypothetical protein
MRMQKSAESPASGHSTDPRARGKGLPWVTSCLPERVSATAGVPQIAAYLLQLRSSVAPGPIVLRYEIFIVRVLNCRHLATLRFSSLDKRF